ncbi:MAG: thioesterase family protein [Acidimicrobiales bacterium]|nr:thioesterase family protein [Acidimicrobiales bacterium]
MSVDPTAVFRQIRDDTFQPSALAVGPWNPGALHGGPPCALLAGVLERTVADAGLGIDFFPARFTAELSSPVPLADLTVTATVRRPGRKICIADASIAGPDGAVAVSATLLCIRRQSFDAGDQDDVATPPGPETGVPLASAMMDGPTAFHRSAVEHRCVSGTSFEAPGPATDWIRLTVPLVEGRSTSPLERVVAAADFGNGVSQRFAMGDVLFVNPDLTVLLHRLPEGEWVCLDAITRIGSEGVGVAESLLFDEHGPIGRSAQTLLVEPR